VRPPKVPSRVKDDQEYFAHQVEGIRAMYKLGSCINTDEMGLGKTFQALTVMAIDFDQGDARKAAVVTLGGLKQNILVELKERTTFKAEILDGTIKQRVKQLDEFFAGDNEVLIMNYEQIMATDYSGLADLPVTLEYGTEVYTGKMTKSALGRVQVDKKMKVAITQPDGTVEETESDYPPMALRDAAKAVTGAKKLAKDCVWKLADGRTADEAAYHAVEHMNRLGFDVIIYDEAHEFKNPSSRTHKAVINLTAKHRNIVLTGSPIMNQVIDLWALLHKVRPDEYPNFWRFRNRYCAFGGYGGTQITETKNPEELHKRLSAVMIHRLKKDVTDLPDKLFIPVTVDLSPTQRKLYDQLEQELELTIPGDPTPMQVENVLTRYLKLKQICGSTGTIEGYDDDSAKLDMAVVKALEVIAGGQPIVIFTQFRDVLKFMCERLAKVGMPTWEIHGHVPKNDRVGVVQTWADAAKGGDLGALVCMYQVGGVGLNMTATNTLIRLDKDWAPMVNNQAVDRVHRIGVNKTKAVTIIDMICRKTVERRVELINKKKINTHNSVVEGHDALWKRDLVLALKNHALEDEEDE
jgi:SNF2 family DNA or RNA helicase